MSPPRGALVLVPNALDLGAAPAPLDTVLPAAAIRRAAALTHWAVEDARSARAFLKRVAEFTPLAVALQQQSIAELPRARKGGGDAVPAAAWAALLAPAEQGHDIGLLSEAGLPAVADPGSGLVAAAHAAGLRVEPLAGPSALLLALAASGLEGQHFAFVGYLPQEAAARAARIRELENLSRRARQAQLMIETPYRNAALWQALVQTLQPTTRLAVACALTLPDATVRMARVDHWRRTPIELPPNRPAVFTLQA